MVSHPPRNLPPTISSSWNRARRTFPHFRRTSLSILGILVALVDPRTTIIGNVDVLRNFRSPLLQRGEQCQGTRAARANVIGPTQLWLRGFCFREQLATLLSEIWRNPCTKIHRDTEGRERARTLSPLTRHADATVPDLQLTRDAARRVCASLAPAHRILTPLHSWHPRSLSHPSSLPLLASTIPITKIEKRRKIVSLFSFFLLLPLNAIRLFVALDINTLSPSARSLWPPLFLRSSTVVSFYHWIFDDSISFYLCSVTVDL